MGGSSNPLRYPSIKKEEVIKKIQEANDQTLQSDYELEISLLLDNLLGKYNNRDTEAIKTHLQTIIDAIGDNIQGSITTKFGGSISKHTHIRGISDVDALVMVNKSNLANESPEKILQGFVTMLQTRLPKTKIEAGDTAVTVHFSDGIIQLIPAIEYKTGIKIPDRNNWSTIVKPRVFSERLTSLNSTLGGRLIPAIKIIKGIIAGFPENSQLKGYHIESLSLQIFEAANIKNLKVKDIVTEFFRGASSVVRKPIKDISGQSAFVDEYLGKKDSLTRLVVADNLDRTFRQIEMADTGRIKSIWSELTSKL